MAKVPTVKSILFYYIIDTKLTRTGIAQTALQKQRPRFCTLPDHRSLLSAVASAKMEASAKEMCQSYCVNVSMAAAEIRHMCLANRRRNRAVQTDDGRDNPFYIFLRNHSRLE